MVGKSYRGGAKLPAGRSDRQHHLSDTHASNCASSITRARALRSHFPPRRRHLDHPLSKRCDLKPFAHRSSSIHHRGRARGMCVRWLSADLSATGARSTRRRVGMGLCGSWHVAAALWGRHFTPHGRSSHRRCPPGRHAWSSAQTDQKAEASFRRHPFRSLHASLLSWQGHAHFKPPSSHRSMNVLCTVICGVCTAMRCRRRCTLTWQRCVFSLHSTSFASSSSWPKSW